MNLISRTITGMAMIIFGLILIGISFFMSFAILIYGLPIFVFGIVILLNKEEDKIERIKDSQSSAEDVKREQIKSNKKLKNEI